jgi:hypothetical protein
MMVMTMVIRPIPIRETRALGRNLLAAKHHSFMRSSSRS